MFLAKHKRRDLTHQQQIESKELVNFNTITQLPNFDRIHWEDMLQLDLYLNSIKLLDQRYDLNLDYSLVEQLWTQWNTQTKKLIYE